MIKEFDKRNNLKQKIYNKSFSSKFRKREIYWENIEGEICGKNQSFERSVLVKNGIEKGFTLIELMVATAIFTIVAVGGISILLASQGIYKRILDTRNATDNLNTLMDVMTREIKFGTNYACGKSDGESFNYNNTNYVNFSFSALGDYTNDDGKCNAIAFKSQDQATASSTVFYFDNVNGSLNKADYKYNSTSGNYQKISDYQVSSSDLIINNFVIKVSGSKSSQDTDSDYLQPGVSIFISGIINLQKDQQGNIVSTSTFALQSFVSQRLLDK